MGEEIIFLNGEFLPQREAGVSVSAPGFLYGWGLFETMRAHKQKIAYLGTHLERLKKSSALTGLRLPYSADKLKAIIRQLVRMNNFKDTYLRLALYKGREGAELVILAREYTPYSSAAYKKGFSAGVCRLLQEENSFLAQIKSASRILYEVNFQEIKKKGFDEGIMLNKSGYLTEGTRSNIFFAKNKELFTPGLECGCLAGITRGAVLGLAQRHKIKCNEGKFSLQDLYNADEAFLTNSLWGVMPLSKVEGIKITKNNQFGRFFIEKYKRVANGT